MSEIKEDIIDIYSEMETQPVGEPSRSRRRSRFAQEEAAKPQPVTPPVKSELSEPVKAEAPAEVIPTQTTAPETAKSAEPPEKPKIANTAAEETDKTAEAADVGGKSRGLFGRKNPGTSRKESKNVQLTKDSEPLDLSRLKKRDLLEIMLRQGEEIDALRLRIAELERALADQTVQFDRIGSLAEASLQITKVFEEADKAAKIYLENVRRLHE